MNACLAAGRPPARAPHGSLHSPGPCVIPRECDLACAGPRSRCPAASEDPLGQTSSPPSFPGPREGWGSCSHTGGRPEHESAGLWERLPAPSLGAKLPLSAFWTVQAGGLCSRTGAQGAQSYLWP